MSTNLAKSVYAAAAFSALTLPNVSSSATMGLSDAASLSALSAPAFPVIETPVTLIPSAGSSPAMAGLQGLEARASLPYAGISETANAYLGLRVSLPSVPQNALYLDVTHLSFAAAPSRLIGSAGPEDFGVYRISGYNSLNASTYLSELTTLSYSGSGLGTYFGNVATASVTDSGVKNLEGKSIYNYEIAIAPGALRFDLSGGDVSSISILFGVQPIRYDNSYGFEIAGTTSLLGADSFSAGALSGSEYRDWAPQTGNARPVFGINGVYGSTYNGPVTNPVHDSGSSGLMGAGALLIVAAAGKLRRRSQKN